MVNPVKVVGPFTPPEALHPTEVSMIVVSYDEHFDTFEVQLDDASPSGGQRSLVPAILMPALTHEYGEPDEFVGRQFIVKPGAKNSDYAKVRNALLNIVEDTQLMGSRERKPVDAVYITAAEKAIDSTPDPSQL